MTYKRWEHFALAFPTISVGPITHQRQRGDTLEHQSPLDAAIYKHAQPDLDNAINGCSSDNGDHTKADQYRTSHTGTRHLRSRRESAMDPGVRGARCDNVRGMGPKRVWRRLLPAATDNSPENKSLRQL